VQRLSLSITVDGSTRRHGGERAVGRETLIGIFLFLNRRMVGWMKCPSSLNRWMMGWMKCLSGWMTRRIQGKLLSSTSSLYLAIVHSYCPSGLRGSFILPLLYVMSLQAHVKIICTKIMFQSHCANWTSFKPLERPWKLNTLVGLHWRTKDI
jgi:hypothetical protein